MSGPGVPNACNRLLTWINWAFKSQQGKDERFVRREVGESLRLECRAAAVVNVCHSWLPASIFASVISGVNYVAVWQATAVGQCYASFFPAFVEATKPTLPLRWLSRAA